MTPAIADKIEVEPTKARRRGRPPKYKKEILKKLKDRIDDGSVCIEFLADEARWLYAWAVSKWGESAPSEKTICNNVGEAYAKHKNSLPKK